MSHQSLRNQGESFAQRIPLGICEGVLNLGKTTCDVRTVVTVTDLTVKFGQAFFFAKQGGGAQAHPLGKPLCVDGVHFIHSMRGQGSEHHKG